MCNMAQLTTKAAAATQACVFRDARMLLCQGRGSTPALTGNCASPTSPRSPATVPATSVVVARPAAPHWQPPRPVGQLPRPVGQLCCSPSLLWCSALRLTTASPAKRHSAKRHSAMVVAAVPELAALGQLHQQHRMWWCLRLCLSVPAVPETELAALGHLHQQHRMWWCLRLCLSLPAVPETAASLDLCEGLCLQLPRTVSHLHEHWP